MPEPWILCLSCILVHIIGFWCVLILLGCAKNKADTDNIKFEKKENLE